MSYQMNYLIGDSSYSSKIYIYDLTDQLTLIRSILTSKNYFHPMGYDWDLIDSHGIDIDDILLWYLRGFLYEYRFVSFTNAPVHNPSKEVQCVLNELPTEITSDLYSKLYPLWENATSLCIEQSLISNHLLLRFME